jgi:hypothetical protein
MPFSGPRAAATCQLAITSDPAGEMFLGFHQIAYTKNDSEIASLRKKFSFLKDCSDNFIKKHPPGCTTQS